MNDVALLDNAVRVCALWALRKGDSHRWFIWYVRDIIVHFAVY